MAGAVSLAMVCVASVVSAEEPEAGSSYAGPLISGIGVGVMGGGVAVLVAAEASDVTIGGSLLGAFGTGTLMAGTAYWMIHDLTEVELEDKVRQGGVALTTLGVGAAGFGGMMILSSYLDVSDVTSPTRGAGIAAASIGGAGLLCGLIMYAVGGPVGEPKAASQLELDVGVGSAGATLRF